MYYRTAIEIDDLFYPAKMNLAVLLNSMNRNAEADTLLREILHDYPEMHEAAYSLGLLLAEMQQYSDAAGYLRQASEGMPERSRIHYNLGLLEQMLGRNTEAEAAMLRALEVEPTNIDFLYALADHYLKRGDLELALGIAERMIATHPENDIGVQMKSFIEAELDPAASPEDQR
jgi:tetratricopeptide (TPR) repeat protein